jgi:3(or 17)beta-hydroxysteroid dehydrogenase
MQVKSKIAIVTGGGEGIGRATAIRLAADGAVVILADVNTDTASETVRFITSHGGTADFLRCDVARDRDWRRLMAYASRRHGGLDILVNNAGVIEALTTQRETFPNIEPERWLRMLDINLVGVLLGTHYAIGSMQDRSEGGAIVNVSSGAGIGFGPHDAPVYAASKAGVTRFTAALAGLRERLNIRVNCICPGWVDTPMSQRTRRELPPEEWAKIAPPAMSPPEEIASAVVMLIRDETLAGRVMLCYEGAPWRLLEPGDEA